MEPIFPKTALKIAIWIFLAALKSKSGYFLGFPEKFSTSIPITSTLRVPPGVFFLLLLHVATSSYRWAQVDSVFFWLLLQVTTGGHKLTVFFQ